MDKFSSIRKHLIEKKLDCALFMTNEVVNPNIIYLTGYKGAGYLLVFANDVLLHVPSRDLNEANLVKGVTISSTKKLSEVLYEKGIKLNSVGIDFANISVLEFNKLRERLNCEFVDLSKCLEESRAVKDKNETSKIEKACKITDEILLEFVNKFKSFKTEQDAASFLVYEALKRGCGVAFDPIVASGINAAIPHHKPYGKIMKGFCVVDFGVKYESYCSDITRTFFIGTPSKGEEKIYADLLKSQEHAISLIKPGVIIGDLCAEAEKNLKQKLIHSIGHGLGIEVHEAPIVNLENKAKLEEGMVITIEPGEYFEGKYGIRIEDDILVTKNGCKTLTLFDKNLIIIK